MMRELIIGAASAALSGGCLWGAKVLFTRAVEDVLARNLTPLERRIGRLEHQILVRREVTRELTLATAKESP